MAKIRLGDTEYDVANLSDHCRKLADELKRVDIQIKEKQNLHAIFLKAKRAYISDLKIELIAAKSGMHFQEE